MRDTIDMAREAGIKNDLDGVWCDADQLEAFAALVRADERNRTWTQEHWTDYEHSIVATEREACAKVCFGFEGADPLGVSLDCAAAIRARLCPPCNNDCDQGRNCPTRENT